MVIKVEVFGGQYGFNKVGIDVFDLYLVYTLVKGVEQFT